MSGFPDRFHAKKQESLEVNELANIKSAKKRILVIETKTLRNKMIKSRVKTLVKKVDAAVAAGDKSAAAASLKAAVVAIDKAAAKERQGREYVREETGRKSGVPGDPHRSGAGDARAFCRR